MDWAKIRHHFREERKRRKLTQTVVAKKGGLDQSAVSKMETDPTYTPQVDTFTKAVEGLGSTVSSFFAQIEGSQPAGLQAGETSAQNRALIPSEGSTYAPKVPADDALADLEYAIGRTIVRAVRVAQDREQAANARTRRATARSRTRKNR